MLQSFKREGETDSDAWQAFIRAMRAVNQVRFIPVRVRKGDMTVPDLSINRVQPSDYSCLNEESPDSLSGGEDSHP